MGVPPFSVSKLCPFDSFSTKKSRITQNSEQIGMSSWNFIEIYISSRGCVAYNYRCISDQEDATRTITDVYQIKRTQRVQLQMYIRSRGCDAYNYRCVSDQADATRTITDVYQIKRMRRVQLQVTSVSELSPFVFSCLFCAFYFLVHPITHLLFMI